MQMMNHTAHEKKDKGVAHNRQDLLAVLVWSCNTSQHSASSHLSNALNHDCASVVPLDAKSQHHSVPLISISFGVCTLGEQVVMLHHTILPYQKAKAAQASHQNKDKRHSAHIKALDMVHMSTIL